MIITAKKLPSTNPKGEIGEIGEIKERKEKK